MFNVLHASIKLGKPLEQLGLPLIRPVDAGVKVFDTYIFVHIKEICFFINRMKRKNLHFEPFFLGRE